MSIADSPLRRVRPYDALPTSKASRSKGAYGLAAVALLLFGTRWASYIGAPAKGLFLTDGLLALAVLRLLWHRFGSHQRSASGLSHFDRTTLWGLGLLVYCAVRYAWRSDLSLVSVRDLAPYGYVGVVWLGAATANRGEHALRRVEKTLITALVLHTVWLGMDAAIPNLADHMPSIGNSSVRLLSVRSDIDGALAFASGWLLLRRYLAKRSLWYGVAGATSLAIAASLPTRAGLLAGTTIAIYTLYTRKIAGSPRRARSRSAAPIMLLLFAALIAVFPTTHLGKRLLGGAGSASAAQAAGTTHARLSAWDAVAKYETATVPRFLFGVGFGPDFMAASGASVALVGPDATETDVRSPHQFWLGSAARLGLVGLVLLIGFHVAIFRRIWENLKNPVGDELDFVCDVLCIAIMSIAMLGVVLESPFGAVPYYWCAGLIIQRRRGLPRGTGSAGIPI